MIDIRRILLTFLLAALVAARNDPAALAGEEKAAPPRGEVAMTSPVDYVFFEVTVNGEKFWAMLDTGADSTFFDAEAAKKAGVKGEGSADVAMEVGGLSIKQAVKIRDLKKLLFSTQQAALQGGRVTIILGHTFCERFLTVVDYRKKKVTFIQAKGPVGDEEFKTLTAPYVGDATDVRTLNLEIIDNNVFITGTTRGKTETFYFCVDTGGAGNYNFLSTVGKEVYNVPKEVTVEIAAGGHTFPGVRLVKCPPCYLDKRAEKMREKDKKLFVGLLGRAFLQPYTAIFDYSRKKLILAK